jgi:Glycoside-hydrolase family GH114
MKRLLIALGTVVALSVALVVAPAWSGAAAPAERPERVIITLPTPNVDWDYQIGGAFPPADSVGIVSRDRLAAPSAGDYNVCYVNAFQTQPNERAFWRDKPSRWALVLKNGRGRPIVDGQWGEFLLDTRTAAKRRALIRIVGRWIDGCADAGFQAAEFDNLDSFYRGKGLITRSHNKAFARLLTSRAHRAGLAAAQKNWSEVSARGPGLGFDFAIAEQCGEFDECGAYAAAYDNRVLVVEYADESFDKTCAEFGAVLSVVRRDTAVSPDGVNRRC